MAVLLVINFEVVPGLVKAVAEVLSSAQVDAMKSRVFNTMIGYFVFIFIFNFYFWRKDSELEKEKVGVLKILNTNPQNFSAQEKLKEIERKRNRYLILIEPIFLISLGLMVGFLVQTLILPLYRSLGAL